MRFLSPESREVLHILGDPGADNRDKRKSKRAEKKICRLDFLLPPLSAPQVSEDGFYKTRISSVVDLCCTRWFQLSLESMWT